MQETSGYSPVPNDSQPRRSSGLGVLMWVVGGGFLLVVVMCAGFIGFAVYVGANGPETSVYVGNQVPAKFLDVAREVDALDDDETVLYFYSDALTDIRKGFYFVSDKRVVIYRQDGSGAPLTTATFDQIADVELARDTSFLTDSQITLQLKSGAPVAFPVSSEYDRDEDFCEAIRSRM
ncbi:MAG: PH domain-containing protein [Pirellulaceae bacterium]|nr:PH domain-containing protein [Planctomycetales bacterium]